MKLLFVQDQPMLISALKMTLASKGFDMVVCNGVLNPHSVIDAVNPDMVIADISKRSGLKYVEEAKSKHLPVMVISSIGNEENLQTAFDNGADDYVSLPLSHAELALRISILFKSKKIKHAA